MNRLASSALLVFVVSVGCGGGAKPTTMPPGGGPAAEPAATNTSIGAAMALSAGAPVTVTLPCAGRVYFGPFEFAQDPTAVKILFANQSLSGAQVCTGGNWVDQNDVPIGGNAGTGCAEGAQPANG